MSPPPPPPPSPRTAGSEQGRTSLSFPRAPCLRGDGSRWVWRAEDAGAPLCACEVLTRASRGIRTGGRGRREALQHRVECRMRQCRRAFAHLFACWTCGCGADCGPSFRPAGGRRGPETLTFPRLEPAVADHLPSTTGACPIGACPTGVCFGCGGCCSGCSCCSCCCFCCCGCGRGGCGGVGGRAIRRVDGVNQDFGNRQVVSQRPGVPSRWLQAPVAAPSRTGAWRRHRGRTGDGK